MLICEICGFSVDENQYRVIGRGVLFKKYFSLTTCNCGGDFVKASKCKECGEHFISTSCFDIFCDKCLGGYCYDKANVN